MNERTDIVFIVLIIINISNNNIIIIIIINITAATHDNVWSMIVITCILVFLHASYSLVRGQLKLSD